MSGVPKPAFWEPGFAAAFNQSAVARAYRLRPPYPVELIGALADLIVDEPRAVLDLGCGPGDLALALLDSADRIDALDASEAMVAAGRSAPRADDPRLRWIHGPAESAPIKPPYALVTAGESLHWMDWPVVMPRIASSLTENGFLAIAGRSWGTRTPEEQEILVRYSTNPGFQPLDLVDELTSRGLFELAGRGRFPMLWTPSIDEYIGARHSQAAVPTDPVVAASFDREMRLALERLIDQGRLETQDSQLLITVGAGVAWGRPS